MTDATDAACHAAHHRERASEMLVAVDEAMDTMSVLSPMGVSERITDVIACADVHAALSLSWEMAAARMTQKDL